MELLLCFAYQSKLLDCLIKRVKITPFSSINEIAELLRTEKYKLLTSADPEVSNWYMSLRTSPLEGIRNLAKALKKHPPISVETSDQALKILLPYPLRMIRGSIHDLQIIFLLLFQAPLIPRFHDSTKRF